MVEPEADCLSEHLVESNFEISEWTWENESWLLHSVLITSFSLVLIYPLIQIFSEERIFELFAGQEIVIDLLGVNRALINISLIGEKDHIRQFLSFESSTDMWIIHTINTAYCSFIVFCECFSQFK